MASLLNKTLSNRPTGLDALFKVRLFALHRAESVEISCFCFLVLGKDGERGSTMLSTNTGFFQNLAR